MSDIFAPRRRITILQGLQFDQDYTLSNEMLQRLLEPHGHRVGLGRIDEDLRWLEQHHLVSIEDGAGGVVIAKLTRRGQDVATGHARVAGVARPPLD